MLRGKEREKSAGDITAYGTQAGKPFILILTSLEVSPLFLLRIESSWALRATEGNIVPLGLHWRSVSLSAVLMKLTSSDHKTGLWFCRN